MADGAERRRYSVPLCNVRCDVNINAGIFVTSEML